MIEILMATYNGAEFLEAQLGSIGEQKDVDWTLIVRDDKSTDDTMTILENFKSLWPNQVTLYEAETSGGSAKSNFLKLIGLSQGDYVMFCDQDDFWQPDKCALTLSRMKKMEERYGSTRPLLVYTDLVVADEALNVVSESFMSYMKVPPTLQLNRLLMQNSVTGCTVMVNKALIKAMEKVVDSERIVMHDHMMAMIALVLGHVSCLHKSTILYRQHGSNSVGAANAHSLDYQWKRFKRGRKAFQQDMEHAMIQAAYFMEVFGQEIPKGSRREMISGFGDLRNKGKFTKIRFYLKYKILKYGLVRKIMQILWT